MKKIVTLLLVLCLCLPILSACSSNAAATTTTKTTATTAAASTTTAKAAETTAAKNNPAITIRIAHQSNEKEAIHNGFLKFKETMEAANVNVKVEIFPAKQLVSSDADAIEACQLGEIDMTSVAEMQFAPFCQAFYIFNADYLFKGIDDARANLDGKLGTTLKDAAKSKKLGVEVATFFGGSLRGIFTSKKALRLPTDLKGVKMRTADNPINIAELQAMGASAIIMAGGECYTGFQQGAIEGWISAMTSHVQQGYMDVCSNVVDTWHTIYLPTVLVNSKKLASMSDAQRAAYDAAVKAATDVQWTQVKKEMDGLYEQLRTMQKAGKATFNELTESERAEWKKVMVGATENMVKAKLGEYSNLLDTMRK